MAKYRIVRDNYSGFEVQVKRRWWPIWMQIGINTHPSVEKAEKFARDHAQPVVAYLGEGCPNPRKPPAQE